MEFYQTVGTEERKKKKMDAAKAREKDAFVFYCIVLLPICNQN